MLESDPLQKPGPPTLPIFTVTFLVVSKYVVCFAYLDHSSHILHTQAVGLQVEANPFSRVRVVLIAFGL